MNNKIPDSPNSESGNVRTKESGDFLHNFYDVMEMIVLALTVISVLFLFVMKSSVVDGSSMEDTLHDQNRLLVWNLFYSPSRGDIVMVQSPTKLFHILHEVDKCAPIIKRVIAVAGDTVEVLANGNFLVNGEPVDGYYDGTTYFTPSTCVVPEGYVYLAGDHRNNSFDSRYFGPVDVRFIQGKAFFRLSPIGEFGIIR